MRVKLLVSFIFDLFILVGCSTISGFFTYGQPTATLEITPNTSIATSTVSPNATLAENEYRIVSPEACSMATLDVIRTDSTQKGLVAWSPDNTILAYVSPRVDQEWYIGDLSLASGTDFSTQAALTSNIQVVGDLLWSPAGDRVAFLAYRKEDMVYTVMTVDRNGNTKDLFPSDEAKTDKYSSTKEILEWLSNDQLSVQTTCGVDCQQKIDVNVTDGTLTNDGDPVQNGTLIPETVVTDDQAYDTNVYPVMTDPAWSPNGNQVAFLDADGTPWLLTQKAHTQSILNVNGEDVSEMIWAPGSKLLAVHVDGSVIIFNIGCSK